MLEFFDLSDMFKVQGISLGFWHMVNPSSALCLVDYKVQFDLQAQKPIANYGSLKQIFKEKQHLQRMDRLEYRV